MVGRDAGANEPEWGRQHVVDVDLEPGLQEEGRSVEAGRAGADDRGTPRVHLADALERERSPHLDLGRMKTAPGEVHILAVTS